MLYIRILYSPLIETNLSCAYFDMKIQGVSQNLIKFLYARIKSSFHVKDFN